MRGFGLGCISFEYVRMDEMNEEDLSQINSEQFRTDLRASLSNLPGINALEVTENLSMRISVTPEELKSDKRIRDSVFVGDIGFPVRIRRGEIQFNLSLPKSEQDSLNIRNSAAGENFQVYMDFDERMPFILIEALSPSAITPSDSIYVVREYIRSALLSTGSNIRIRALGPSPFPADIWMTNHEVLDELGVFSTEDFQIETSSRKRGRNAIYYLWPKNVDVSSKDCLQALKIDLRKQSSLYYEITVASNQRLWLNREIMNKLDETVELTLGKAIRTWFIRVLRNGHKVRVLMVKVIQLKMITITQRKEFSEKIEDLYSLSISNSLRSDIEEKLRETFVGELEATQDLIQTLQTSRSQEMTNFLVVFSFLIAILIGILA